jgi:hypothetical protein
VDVYGVLMMRNVYGGLPNGFFSTTTYAIPEGKKIVTATVDTPRMQECDPTIAIRTRF